MTANSTGNATGNSTGRSGQLKIVVVGHVDHGKSTLIGRLLYDTGALPEAKVAELEAASERRGMPVEWSFALDAFQAERDQAITIDTTQIWFRTARRDVVIIDAPGHREFLQTMISGAAPADAAVLVVDAAEGIREQSRRHAYLLHLLGLRQIAVVVNKMDLVDHDAARFVAVKDEIERYLGELGIAVAAIIPASARNGDNLGQGSAMMPWYTGPILTEALDHFEPLSVPTDRPLRLPIQDVYKFDERRILVGRIETGILRVGDTLMFSPSNRTATVKSIEAWNGDQSAIEAKAGQCIGITLDEQIFVERGDVASHVEKPPVLSAVFKANLFWLGREPLTVGRQFKMKLATDEAQISVVSIERVINTETLGSSRCDEVRANEVAEVVLRAREMLSLDEGALDPATGRCVLIDIYDTVAGGIVTTKGYPDQRQLMTRRSTNIQEVEHLLTPAARAWRNGHKGAVIWFTGLSGAGKSTLAMKVEQRLFAKGFQTYVLDGDNVRSGLCSDLGFVPEERAENIRRVGEVSALFADAGFVAITAFISPYQADRDRVRKAAGESFHEIYIKADLATCEARDPKGLYKKARDGTILDFTGVSAPYEAPEQPELVVETAGRTVEECVDVIVDYIGRNISLAGHAAESAA